MSNNSMHLQLCRLIEWHKRADTGGWPSISIMYRMVHEGHVGSSGRPGHRILCPEMASDLRRCQAAFNAVDMEYKVTICAKLRDKPEKEDGKPEYKEWGDREKAHYVNENVHVFRNKYKKAVRAVEKASRRLDSGCR